MSDALVLIGLSGSGKSTAGRLLAARLHLQFTDTDRTIEVQAGKTVAEIFAAEGEEAFRLREQEAVAEACLRPGVVAVGGGAVLRESNRVAMRRGNLVAWLDPPVALLARRLLAHAQGEERPLLRGDPHERLRALWRARRQYYAMTAHVRVDVPSSGPNGSNVIAAQLARIYQTWQEERTV